MVISITTTAAGTIAAIVMPLRTGTVPLAGGLEAVSALLRRTTVDGAAFVVVQHLAPNQNSMLTELLGRASILAVQTVEDGVVIEPNHVYVTPPNVVLALEGGTIRLLAPALGARPEMPIDAFFRSLAENRGIKSMGVVMSGTGTSLPCC